MSKSMYSLILSDEVVKAVDHMAYAKGTSRSNLINHVLAEHLSLVTPEKLIRSVYAAALEASGVSQNPRIQRLSSGRNSLEVRSILDYKYNPTIRYSINLGSDGEGYTGEFRVASRTQSAALLSMLQVFFEIWSQIEHFCLAKLEEGRSPSYEIGEGRYRRILDIQEQVEDTALLGEAIGSYLRLFDHALELYFNAPNGVDMETYEAILSIYQKYLDNSRLII